MSSRQSFGPVNVIVAGSSRNVPCAQFGLQLSACAVPVPAASPVPQPRQVIAVTYRLPSPDAVITVGRTFICPGPVQNACVQTTYSRCGAALRPVCDGSPRWSDATPVCVQPATRPATRTAAATRGTCPTTGTPSN